MTRLVTGIFLGRGRYDGPSFMGHSDLKLLRFAVTVEFTARVNVEKCGHFCIVNYGIRVNIAGGNA